jgi:hypothetical protein
MKIMIKRVITMRRHLKERMRRIKRERRKRKRNSKQKKGLRRGVKKEVKMGLSTKEERRQRRVFHLDSSLAGIH